MDRFNSLITHLRGLLAEPPTADLWAAIVASLDTCPPAQIDLVLDYLEPHLAEWPDALRAAPASWTERLLREGTHEPRFRAARALTASPLRLGPRLVKLVCRRDELTHLRHLDLSGSPMMARGTESLAHCKHLAGLEQLALRGCRLGMHGVGRLSLGHGFAALRALNLSDNFMGGRGLELLLVGGRLESLTLQSNLLDRVAMRALANADLGRLRWLDLSANLIGDDALEALLEAPWLPGLRGLSLAWSADRFDGPRMSEPRVHRGSRPRSLCC